MGSLRAAAWALIASLTQASLAAAQPKPQVQLQAAGDLVKKAIARSQAGDHVQAIELYQQAFLIIPQPILLSNMGAEYQLAQQPAEAVVYFCKYLAAEPEGANAQFVTTQVKSLQSLLGHETEAGDVCEVKPKAVPPAPAPVPTQPPAAEAPPITATTIAPSAGPSTERDSHSGRVLEVVGVAAAVVGGVSIALGVHYALEGRSLSKAIDAHVASDPWPASIDGVPIADWQRQGDAWNRDTYIFSIVGGAALAAGVTMFVLGHGRDDTSASTEHAHLLPVVTPTQSGFAVVGRF